MGQYLSSSSPEEGGEKKKETKASDRTAAAVAKIRHLETLGTLLSGGEKTLFMDPFAHLFNPYSTLIPWLPIRPLMGFFPDFYLALHNLLVGRTREFDEQVLSAVDKNKDSSSVKQYVILGAGYDTRPYRLDLPNDLKIFEVDQVDVQEKKLAALAAGVAGGLGNLPNRSNVSYVTIDFNKGETLDMVLRNVQGYDPTVPTIFTLEGVTQYIPKASTASILRAAAAVCGPGSRIVFSYIPQDFYDAPEKCNANPKDAKRMLEWVARDAGEPWVSGWNQEDMAEFVRKESGGFEVQRDISIRELVDEYFKPASRNLPEKQQIIIERYATAFKE